MHIQEQTCLGMTTSEWYHRNKLDCLLQDKLEEKESWNGSRTDLGISQHSDQVQTWVWFKYTMSSRRKGGVNFQENKAEMVSMPETVEPPTRSIWDEAKRWGIRPKTNIDEVGKLSQAN